MNIETPSKGIKEQTAPKRGLLRFPPGATFDAMNSAECLLFFDYVDPLSFFLELELREAVREVGVSYRRVPFEVRPPPQALVDPDGEWWRQRWTEALHAGDDAIDERILSRGLPQLVPWTRKAHELVAHATAEGVGEPAHRAVFQAYLVDGKDIGRVDVLAELAGGLGLDPTQAKVVLDVDRYAADIASARAEAETSGIGRPATLMHGGEWLEGFHKRDALRTFLLR